MYNIELMVNEHGDGAFQLQEGSSQLGMMDVNIAGKVLTVNHTEVIPEAEGKGLAKMLFEAMLEYARKQHMQVVARCPYVLMQFKRHPERFADVWKKGSPA